MIVFPRFSSLGIRSYVYALDVRSSGDSGLDMNLLKMKRIKNDFLIDREWENIDLEELRGELKGKPVVVSFDGDDVFHRIIGKDFTSLSDLLPGVRVSDLYVQRLQLTQGQESISFTKLDRITKLVDHLGQYGCLVAIRLGPFSCQALIEKLCSLQPLTNGRIQVEITDGFYSLSPSVDGRQIHLGDETIQSGFIGAYLAAIDWFIGVDSKDPQPLLKDRREAWKYSEWTKRVAYGGIAVLFVLLIANFLWTDSLRKDSDHLAEELALLRMEHKESIALRERVALQEDLLDIVGSENNVMRSILVDRISASLPKELSFTRVEVDPLKKSKDKKKGWQVEHSKMLIEGLMSSESALTDWIEILQNQDFIKEVDIQRLNLNSKSTKRTFVLELKIQELK